MRAWGTVSFLASEGEEVRARRHLLTQLLLPEANTTAPCVHRNAKCSTLIWQKEAGQESQLQLIRLSTGWQHFQLCWRANLGNESQQNSEGEISMGRRPLSTQLLFREPRSALPCVRGVLTAVHPTQRNKTVENPCLSKDRPS